MQKLKSHLPPIDAILPVLAIICFLVYGWTLVTFFWKVPSWMQFLTPGEILVLLAYSMTSAMLESLSWLGILLLICLILPTGWVRDVFVTRGTIAAIFGLGTIMLYMYLYSVIGYSHLTYLVPWSLAGLVITLVITYLSTHMRPVVRAAGWISDRMIVFLFLVVPISLVSLLVVIYRNLF